MIRETLTCQNTSQPLAARANRLAARANPLAARANRLAARISRALRCGALVLCACASCRAAPPPQMELVLGTVCGVHLFNGGSEQLYARIFARVREIDRTMGVQATEFQTMLGGGFPRAESPAEAARMQADSAVSGIISGLLTINTNAGIEAVPVRADLFEVLEKAKYYAELSGGAFDPTIGPLVKLWGIGNGNEAIPDADEIADALERVNWRDLILDPVEKTAFLRRRGMALDLGAIAKGYAADEAARLARAGGANHGLFDFGGNIVVTGYRDNGKGTELAGQPWRIGIQDPLQGRGHYLGVLPVHDKTVVTSGVYERYFESEGRRYHHILSTTDGWPVTNGLLSVTIVAERSIDADALSTAVFALGYETGRALIDATADTEALFVFDDRRVIATDGLTNRFSLIGDAYTLETGTAAPAVTPLP